MFLYVKNYYCVRYKSLTREKMFLFSLLIIFILLNIICDVNYFIRTVFTVLSGKIYQQKSTLKDTTTIYGIGTFQDCDVRLRSVREARLLRELDMARYHFYDKTGIYRRSRKLNIHSLQGCTLTVTYEPLPLFRLYKINTKLVYWDDCSLFLEHEVITLSDGKTHCFMVSRQHALGNNGQSTKELIKDLPGSEQKPLSPQYINKWVQSMLISSAKLR